MASNLFLVRVQPLKYFIWQGPFSVALCFLFSIWFMIKRKKGLQMPYGCAKQERERLSAFSSILVLGIVEAEIRDFRSRTSPSAVHLVLGQLSGRDPTLRQPGKQEGTKCALWFCKTNPVMKVSSNTPRNAQPDFNFQLNVVSHTTCRQGRRKSICHPTLYWCLLTSWQTRKHCFYPSWWN